MSGFTQASTGKFEYLLSRELRPVASLLEGYVRCSVCGIEHNADATHKKKLGHNNSKKGNLRKITITKQINLMISEQYCVCTVCTMYAEMENDS